MKFNRRQIFQFFIFAAVVIVAVMFFCDESFARPGGGHGFHGGGSRPGGGHGFHGGGGYHGSGSYSGGSGGGIFINFSDNFGLNLLFNIALWALIIYLKNKIFGGDDDDGQVTSRATAQNLVSKTESVNAALTKLISKDNNFSVPVFLDYVTMLYNKFYLSRNTPEADEIKPFFSGLIPDFGRSRFSEIAIGAAEISGIYFSEGKVTITVAFSANFTSTNPDTGKSMRYIVEEEWIMSRLENAQSPKPQGFGVLRCPNCGGTLDFKDYGNCQNCGTHLSFQAGGWTIGKIVRQKTEKSSTHDMLTYSDEEGTDYPTIYSKTIAADLKTFKQQHLSYSSSMDFERKIVRPYFNEIYKNWSDGTWNKTRHLISERQWQNFNAYLKQLQSYGYSNRLENVQITKTETVKYNVDYNYEMITVRIFAECLDYVVNSQGVTVAGNDKKPRRFSEYWTFVANKNAKMKSTDLHSCPNCGAPVEKIGESGICEYCNSKITDGNFSWILFSITQDEVYSG
jgi:hypothetical protein